MFIYRPNQGNIMIYHHPNVAEMERDIVRKWGLRELPYHPEGTRFRVCHRTFESFTHLVVPVDQIVGAKLIPH